MTSMVTGKTKIRIFGINCCSGIASENQIGTSLGSKKSEAIPKRAATNVRAYENNNSLEKSPRTVSVAM